MAIFDGTVKPGLEGAMRRYVNDELAPLWRQFTGAIDVKVMFGVDQDPDGPTIPCILQITYPDRAAMAQALDSPARYKSRDMLPGFYERFFDGVKLYHYVMEV
ncbi:MAG: hypothetical protein ACPGRD_02095 [Planktomarina sp.]